MVYQHNNKDPNLNNLHHAMEYSNDLPHLRVTLGSDTITITGDVNLLDSVRVNNTEDQSIPVHLTAPVSITGPVSVTGAVSVTGPVSVTNWPTIQSVTGAVSVTGPVSVTNWPSVQSVTGAVSVTGSVAISSIPEVEIKNDINNPLPISSNTTLNSNANPIYVKGTSDTSFFSPTQSDAFGRLRVSNPFTLADHFNRYQDNGSSFNYTSGGGSTGYDANNAAVTMTVGTANGDTAYRETSRVFAYQPGKSLLILQTFTFAAAKTNLTQRAGYFDAANGFYLEQVGTEINFVKRSSSSGVLTETRKKQSEWNVNTLLPSGLTLSNSQIFWMDIEWLGVGSVRMGFVIDGQFIHCHTWNHANQITGTYMTTSCLPVRKEIFNKGTTASSSTMLSICTSVVSEGGYTFTGRESCIGHTLGSPVSLPNDLSIKPIMSIRLKNTRLGAIVIPTTYNVTPVQSGIFKYQIYSRAITTGGTWTSAGADSSIEYNLSPASISSGNIVLSAFINASNQSSGTSSVLDLSFDYQLERNSFTSTCYEFVVAVASSVNISTCYGTINWKEVT